MATSIFSRRNIFRNSINSNVLFMKNLLNATPELQKILDQLTLFYNE